MKSTFLKTNLGIFIFCLLVLGFSNVSEGNTLPTNIEPLPVCDWEAPQNLQTTSITPVSVSLAWNIPVTGPAPGGYQVKTILISTGAVVNTVKTPNLSQTISGLTMGTEYRFEVSSICAGNEVSSRLVGITIITVYVDEIINTECPETPNSYTPTGSFYNAVLNGSNTSDDLISIPFNSSSLNSQIYFWNFYTPNNNSRYTKLIIVRELPIGTEHFFHYKSKVVTTWRSELFPFDKSIVIYNQSNTAIAKIVLDQDTFRVKRLSGTVYVKADLTCACNGNVPNPSCYMNTQLVENNDDSVDSDLFSEEIQLKNILYPDFNLYPNPATDDITINYHSSYHDPVSITILNFNGSIVKRIDSTNETLYKSISSSVIDISDLPFGIYSAMVSINGKMKTLNFIKTN